MPEKKLRFSDFVTVCWLIACDIVVTEKNGLLPWATRDIARARRLEKYVTMFSSAAKAYEEGAPVTDLPLLPEHLAFARDLAPRTEDPDSWRTRWEAVIDAAKSAMTPSEQLMLAFD